MRTTIGRLIVLFAVVAIVMLGLSGTWADTNLVLNPGFENPSQSGGPGYTTVPPGTLADWSIVTGDVQLIDTYWVPNSGLQSLDLNGTVPGGISQDLVTIPLHAYDLSFFMSGNFDDTFDQQSPTTRTVEIFWGGSSLGSFDFTEPSGWGHSSMGWTSISGGTLSGLLASGTSTELQFVSSEPGTWGPVLDDVAVFDRSQPVVPEPGTLALLGLALPMGGMWLRRRRATK